MTSHNRGCPTKRRSRQSARQVIAPVQHWLARFAAERWAVRRTKHATHDGRKDHDQDSDPCSSDPISIVRFGLCATERISSEHPSARPS